MQLARAGGPEFSRGGGTPFAKFAQLFVGEFDVQECLPIAGSLFLFTYLVNKIGCAGGPACSACASAILAACCDGRLDFKHAAAVGNGSAESEKPSPWTGLFAGISGADCRFRTGHLMITNQLLYQMS